MCRDKGLRPRESRARRPVLSAGTVRAREAVLPRHPRLTFLDTEHILGPVWDAAGDYSHALGKVFGAVGRHVVRTVAASLDDEF